MPGSRPPRHPVASLRPRQSPSPGAPSFGHRPPCRLPPARTHSGSATWSRTHSASATWSWLRDALHSTMAGPRPSRVLRARRRWAPSGRAALACDAAAVGVLSPDVLVESLQHQRLLSNSPFCSINLLAKLFTQAESTLSFAHLVARECT